jgi:hypothetical protein
LEAIEGFGAATPRLLQALDPGRSTRPGCSPPEEALAQAAVIVPDSLHRIVTPGSLAVFHKEPMDNGRSETVLYYLTAGVVWAFAVVVACMTAWPI